MRSGNPFGPYRPTNIGAPMVPITYRCVLRALATIPASVLIELVVLSPAADRTR